MSKIYEALKQVEGETGALSRPERRRTVRGRIRIPLFVYGYGPEDTPFYVYAETIEINAHGALISTHVTVLPSERLLITNKTNLKELQCAVISSVAKEGSDEVELAIAFDHASPSFWFKERGATPRQPEDTNGQLDALPS